MGRKQQTHGLVALAMLVAGFAPIGCAPAGPERPGSREEGAEPAVERARAAARMLAQRLTAALSEQLERGAPATAITVCSEIAPAAAAELSGDGLEIRRTSLKYRNPANAPDSWERAWLERLAELHAAGELPREVHEAGDVEGEVRYLRPIVVAPDCLRCHGAVADLDAGVRDRLAERYPGDLATGYLAGDLRGAFSVRVRPVAPAPG